MVRTGGGTAFFKLGSQYTGDEQKSLTPSVIHLLPFTYPYRAWLASLVVSSAFLFRVSGFVNLTCWQAQTFIGFSFNTTVYTP